MTKIFKFLAASVIALFAVGSLTACASSPSIDMKSVTAVIDVRTPAEFATGHLDGAMNIDIQAADAASKLDALDHAGNYVVYCHSGNRAGQAINYMTGAGFTGTLTNAGGVADASSATGISVVQ